MDPVTLPCYNYFVSTLPQGWWMWGGRLTPAADPQAWGLRSSDQRNRLVVTLPVRRHLLKAVPCQDINTQNAKINVSLTKKEKKKQEQSRHLLITVIPHSRKISEPSHTGTPNTALSSKSWNSLRDESSVCGR